MKRLVEFPSGDRGRAPGRPSARSPDRGEGPTALLPGRMASAESHRQMVVSEIEATIPCSMAAGARSGVPAASGTPLAAGSSHASALIATTTSGERPGPPGSWSLLEPDQALLVKPLALLGDDLTGVPSRAAISSLAIPSAASSRILARVTSRYAEL